MAEALTDALPKLMNANRPRPGWPFSAIPSEYLMVLSKDGPDYDLAVTRLIAAGWRLDECIDCWVGPYVRPNPSNPDR